MAKITDPAEISNQFVQIKQATESGYYAPVLDIELDEKAETFSLTLDYPDAGDEEFVLSVPQYWEDDRTLPTVLRSLDVPIDNIGELENRSIPVQRVDGSWEVDMTRLNNGDYITGHSYTQ